MLFRKKDSGHKVPPPTLTEAEIDLIIRKLLNPIDGIKLKTVKGISLPCFSGARLVKWIRSQGDADSQKFATLLMERGIFHSSTNDRRQDFQCKKGIYYTFTIHNEERPLNACKTQTEEVIDAVGLSKRLVTLAASMMSECVTPAGTDFSSVKKGSRFIDLCLMAAGLQEVYLCVMSPEERSAFYINIYNALALHSRFLLCSEPKDVIERKYIMSGSYLIGQQTWTMKDLSDSIRGIGEIGTEGCHPILNCLLFNGSDECAPIRPYSPEELSSNRLRDLMDEFLRPRTVFDWRENKVVLPHSAWTIKGDFGPEQPKNFLMSLSYMMRSRSLREAAATLEVLYTSPNYRVVKYIQ